MIAPFLVSFASKLIFIIRKASPAMLNHQSSDTDSLYRQRTTASMPGPRDYFCSSTGHPVSVKSVSFPSELENREQSRTFRTRVHCFEAGEYQRVRRGSLVPRLDLSGPGTPKKQFSGPTNVALLRREGRIARERLLSFESAKLD